MQTQDTLKDIWYNSGEIHYDIRFFAPFIPWINQALLSHRILSGNLLDLGCGYGEKANVFRKIGFNVTGIDYDGKRIQKATEDFPGIDFRHFKFTLQLPFPDNTFDVIFSCSVLQYMDRRLVLDECKRILKPGGCLILIENLKNNPVTRTGRTYLKLKKFKYQSFPYNHFTYGEIMALRQQFGACSVHFNHLLTPLSHFRIARNQFARLEKLDRLLLKLVPLKRLSWLGFFSGINIKNDR